MRTEIQGLVNGCCQQVLPEESFEQVRINNRGELLVAYGLPWLSEIVRLGNSYQCSTTTAATPVVAVPTTASLILIWNGENDNGKSYIIDSVFCLTVAGTANSQQNVTILANVGTIPTPGTTVQPFTANLITPRSLMANSVYRGKAVVSTGKTLNSTDGAAANWFPVGTSSPPAGVAPVGGSWGQNNDIDCKGMFIVPPKCVFAVTAIATAATASSVQIGFRWHELIVPPVV